MNVVILTVGVVYGSCKASHLPERCTERSAVYCCSDVSFHIVSVIVASVYTAVGTAVTDKSVACTALYGVVFLVGGQAAGRKQQEKCERQSYNQFHNCATALLQILLVKRLDVVKRYFLQIVIKVSMARAGHNEQLLIVARQLLEGVLAHVS